MLPFDNKSEFMVQLDLPAGTPREDALAVGQDVARRLLREPVVRDVQVYSGEAAPFTFVGMVRHSFLRRGDRMVDIQVNLVGKGDRKEQSHAIAVRLRPEILKLALPDGTRMKVVEIPPGPPVMDTLVAEVYGPTEAERLRFAGEVVKIFRSRGRRRGRGQHPQSHQPQDQPGAGPGEGGPARASRRRTWSRPYIWRGTATPSAVSTSSGVPPRCRWWCSSRATSAGAWTKSSS